MTTTASETTPARAHGTVPALVVPLWPSRGFWGFCRYEIRKGIMIRYWITLPAMWRREQQFRQELTDCLNGHNNAVSGGAERRTLDGLVRPSEVPK